MAHHFACGIDIGFEAIRRDLVTDQMVEIAQRLGACVRNADGRHLVVAGNPDAAAGHRAGAAVLRRLFEHRDRQPARLAGQRGSHAAGSGADHEHIELLIPAHRKIADAHGLLRRRSR